MKNVLVMLIVAGILFASTAQSATIVTDTVYLQTTFVNQDPYPAEPGGYVDLAFKVENWGTERTENVVFELLPAYPFSLDPGSNATKQLGTITGLQTDEDAFLLRYKVRVDNDAIKGDNEIALRYTYGNNSFEEFYITEKFNVSISDPRTDFDVIVQDSTATSTTLAIANIGANTAYSAIVKIPEQEAFIVTGASANVMGSLDAGEYTLASFQITSVGANATMGRGNATAFGNSTQIRENANFTMPNATMGGNVRRNLTVEIYYTDALGIRRTVQKEVRLDTSFGINGTLIGMRTTQTSQSLISNGLLYIIIGVIGIVAIAVFFKLRRRAKK